MKRQITLHNRIVFYSIRRSETAKRLRLAMYSDGNFVITLPKGINESIADKYIIKKSQWALSKLDFFKNISISKTLKFTTNDYLKHKYEVMEWVTKRIKYFNKKYRYRYNNIFIRNQKTLWGSCTKKKNLNFNFKIAFLPHELRDYIIVHELCHLKEPNHSHRFWNLVSKTISNYREVENSLKIKGLEL